MTEKLPVPVPLDMSTRKQWCEGWKTGFWAASLLFSGRYRDYATLRDEFLGHANPERAMLGKPICNDVHFIALALAERLVLAEVKVTGRRRSHYSVWELETAAWQLVDENTDGWYWIASDYLSYRAT